MRDDERYAKFDVKFIENDRIKIETDECSIVTEYFEDKNAVRTTMTPANIFFSAFALWASFDILAFCRKRNISTDSFRISQTVNWHRKHTNQSKVILLVQLPDHFPKKYDKAIKKSIDNCMISRLGKGLNSNSFQSKITR